MGEFINEEHISSFFFNDLSSQSLSICDLNIEQLKIKMTTNFVPTKGPRLPRGSI